MFERFTDRARRVVVLAQEEARILRHNYIGTEHILLGILHDADNDAARALTSLGVSLDAIRQDVREIIGPQGEPGGAHIPFTPRAKRVLELSLREALQLGDRNIGPEHVLLGLLREGEGVACQVLVQRGVTLKALRTSIIGALRQPEAETAPSEPSESMEPRCGQCGAPVDPAARVKTVELPVDGDDERRAVTVVYCGICGRLLGTLS